MPLSSSIFYFKTCCFCISLRRGCFIMAYMQLVGIIIGLIYAAVVLGSADSKDIENISSLWIAIIILLFLTIIVAIIFDIGLLIGLHKNKPGYVKAYLIFNFIVAIIFAVFIILSLVSGHATASAIIKRIIQLLINIYILLVYRSYYINMIETPEQAA